MLPRTHLLVALTCLVIAVPALASPRDTKVGDVRTTYNREGTPLREKASTLGKPVAALPAGTQVRVLEANLPWIRVQTVARAGAPSQAGWLYAYETVEAGALSATPPPPFKTYKGGRKGGSAGASQREVSAAGRQLDAGTERTYRAGRQDLERAYAAVDRIEARTQAMDPYESIAFIMEGRLGRKGHDYARPGRVAAAPPSRNKQRAKVGGLLGKAGGAALRHFGADDKVARLAEAGGEFFEGYLSEIKVKFTPQQEYYLGRAVAAEAIAKYGLCKDKDLQRYVRLVGDTVVRLTNRMPANFGGYHFAVLESDTVNGISGPGGFVLLTRGAVEAAQSEAELAGVLSHELAHISAKHGESLLRKGGKFPAMMKGLSGAASAAVGGQAGQWAGGLVKFFGEAVAEMKSTAINHGYGKALEYAADKEGTWLLVDVYYDHTAVKTFLQHMRDEGDAHADAATHASPAARARALDPVIAPYPPFKPAENVALARATRFAKALGREPALPSFGAPK